MTEPTFVDDCKTYIKLHAQQTRLKARMEVVRERLLPQLRDGKLSPRNLPYVLKLQKRLLIIYGWKDALQSALKFWLEDDAKVKERMDEIERDFPTKESEALCVEMNKSMAAKL